MVGVECAVDSIETDMLLPGGIVCDVASGTPGASGFIVVTTTSGGASPGTEPFSFYSLPSIASVDPSEGPQAGMGFDLFTVSDGCEVNRTGSANDFFPP